MYFDPSDLVKENLAGDGVYGLTEVYSAWDSLRMLTGLAKRTGKVVGIVPGIAGALDA